MKHLYVPLLLLFSRYSTAQDLIYLADGTKLPGKIIEISAEKVRFKNLANPTGPTYSRTLDKVLFAFNAAGDYVVFDKAAPVSEKDKEAFLGAAPPVRFLDAVVDAAGAVTTTVVASETEAELVTSSQGQETRIPKASLAFVVRRNGTHQVFLGAEQALPVLAASRGKLGSALPAAAPAETAGSAAPASAPLARPSEKAPTPTTEPAAGAGSAVVAPMDMKLFNRKALEKTEEFTGYMQIVSAVNTNREAAKKGINLACALFLDTDSRVEVSNANSAVRNKYKVRDYLDRLMLRSGQFDKVQIEYANVNYASKFKKGADGNYYGVVTFVQTFRGFVDNKLVYGDVTKRNVTVVLKPYEKAVNGEYVAAWDVFLDDVGVVETKKI